MAERLPHIVVNRGFGDRPIFRGKVKKKLGTTMHGIPRVWFCALSAK